MDFITAMNYIDEKNKLGIVPGLDNIRELLRRLGNPQNMVKCIHIAGTNGKGSIFSYVEDILLASGYKIGRYISPTIFTYLERFQINKKMMTEEEFSDYIERISKVIDAMLLEGYGSPTAFEIETAIAFLYYMENKVDYALVECGMGGSEDATNVIDNPLLVTFASISRDHMQFLGETLTEIASNKAGIIKRGCGCIAYPQEHEVTEILNSVCVENETSLNEVSYDDVELINEDLCGTEFLYKGNNYKISMLGIHQVYNAVTAIEVAKELRIRGASQITDAYIKAAIEKTSWPGRFSRIKDNPLIFVDGAHNEKAWILLKETLNKYFTNKRIIYIIGVLKDKEYNKMLDILCDTMKCAITVTPPGIRGLKKEILAELIDKRGIESYTAENASDALGKALDMADSDDVVLICGSLSFISEYLTFYK